MRRNADNWSHVSATLVPDSPSKVPSMGYVPKDKGAGRWSQYPGRQRMEQVELDTVGKMENEGFSEAQRRDNPNNKSSYTPMGYNATANPEGPGCCAIILTIVSYLLIIATFPFSLCMCIKVVQEYERAVIFRLGRLLKGGAKGPGIFFVVPCIDSYRKVDLRTVSFDVPPQEILSRDSVTVSVDAVVYYRVSDPIMAETNVEDYSHSTRLLAATTLRNVLGTKNLAEILSERESISHNMQSSLDEATDPWGVKVERVEIKDVRLPVQLQRAMAAEAEAAREARAKVIAAEGEQRASRALKEAAEVINESPAALQLRYLQTLSQISAEKNSTIIFPLPIDLINNLVSK
ncbi:band 7 protein AGAP004871-like isoform X4 [Portunus trituberculatus]|uniref:band 7 protein AGAP004871-like isoform X4 n=1 Tax=Portunus trituberculatus TaxID=210409 RepID=UPI001E1CD69E|nr:band 7 protein AGAP004871-like isoform X4 [Portunus trituberculatus]